MNPKRSFRLYMAVRLHFTTKYDVFETQGKISWVSKMETRKDFHLINGLIGLVTCEAELIDLCVANFLYANPNFMYNNSEAEENWNYWKKVKSSYGYFLQIDINHIEMWIRDNNASLESYMKTKLISDLLSRKVQYESIIILNQRINVLDMIQGFDAPKYKVRMYKAQRFVVKGNQAHMHTDPIDNFLAKIQVKEEINGNLSIGTSQITLGDV